MIEKATYIEEIAIDMHLIWLDMRLKRDKLDTTVGRQYQLLTLVISPLFSIPTWSLSVSGHKYDWYGVINII